MKTYSQFIYIIACIGLTMLAACKKAPSKETKEAKFIKQQIEEVMAIHDSVMPKTGELFKLKKRLSVFENSIQDSLMLQEIYRTKKMLVDADDAMMNWMHEFREADPMLSFEEKKTYYLDEKKKITEVKIKMLASIDSANSLLKLLETDAK